MASLQDLINTTNNAQQVLNNANGQLSQSSGQFTSGNNGNQLPYTSAPEQRPSYLNRNIISWFVPEFGIVKMFVNPENITYADRKVINADRTKGGYTLQYWGEDLTKISISGTTGSSSIEGINMLNQIYRAEQLAFDGVGLTLDANNAAADLSNNIISGVGGMLGQGFNSLFGGSSTSATAAAGGAGILGGILGLDSPNNNLSVQNIPSLAQLAFTVEMYYGGWVYRGYFESMTVTETTNFLFQYQISFVATTRKGTRQNFFPWTKSPKQPSVRDNPQYSFSGNVGDPGTR